MSGELLRLLGKQYGRSWSSSLAQTVRAAVKWWRRDWVSYHFAAESAHARFEETHDAFHLDEAVRLSQLAIEIAPKPEKRLLGWLGIFLRHRYDHLGDSNDLEASITALECALSFIPDEHPERAPWLSQLASSLQCRFERYGALSDLERTIEAKRRAVELTPDKDIEKATRLSNYALTLKSRFERLGDPVDLGRAIEIYHQAINLASNKQPASAAQLSNLGAAFLARFETLGEVSDLERATEAIRQAVEFTPDTYPQKPNWVSNYGMCMLHRFERFGQLGDLESAIEIQRRAVQLTPDGHPEKPIRLTNYGSSLDIRFRRMGELDDIERAIESNRQAVALTPEDHFDKPTWLNNYGLSLQSRFDLVDELDDLERAIEAHRYAMELTPDGHPRKPTGLSNYGISLLKRFERLEEPSDLERAVEVQRSAVELTSHGDPSLLNNYCHALQDRFLYLGNLSDLELAIEISRQSVKLTPDGHPDSYTRLDNLGRSLALRFGSEESKEHFDDAISCLLDALTHPLGSQYRRIMTARDTLQFLEAYPAYCMPGTLLSVHSRVIDIVPEIVWLGHSMARRLKESRRLGGMVTKAVRAAIAHGDLIRAAEWLEAGRTLIWSQTLALRSPIEDLTAQDPELASALRGVQAQLQSSAPASFGTVPTLALNHSNLRILATNADTDRHRQLAIEYGQLLAEVRGKPGFEDYLRPRKLSVLLPSLTSLHGNIVFINVDSVLCDALILSSAGEINSVELSGLSLKRAETLRSLWQSYLRYTCGRQRGVVYQGPLSRNVLAARLFKHLWMWVVQPVLHKLGFDERKVDGGRLPHITWCPTGPLTQLPLHAAGIYADDSGPHVYDFVVSSYTPSLSALVRAIDEKAKIRQDPSVLVVTQPHTPGLPPIAGTLVEGERLRNVLSKAGITTSSFDDTQATISTVRADLKQHSWLHFACHGFQNLEDPTKSAFALHDGSLSLADLMSTTADNAELAFLSACQTAAGDETIPEESMHLAAGMMGVGFKGVTATMWSIRDEDAPLVVETYYKSILELRSSTELGNGETGAAYALHDATKLLRDTIGAKEFVRWAPFVHFGI